MDILNSAGFLDIQKSISGYPKMNYVYPKIELSISWIQYDFWISKNVFKDILKYTGFWFYVFLDIQKWIIDIQKSICGYP